MLPKTWITPGKVSNGSVGMHFSVQFIQQCIAFAQTGIPPLKILKNAVFCEWIEPPSPSLSLDHGIKKLNTENLKKSQKDRAGSRTSGPRPLTQTTSSPRYHCATTA